MAPVFFRYWIGPDFALVAAPVAKILFLGAWINGHGFVAFTLLQSQGRPDLTGKLHTAEILPYLAVLWGLTTTFGVAGAAVAWTLRCTADALAMFWAANIPKRDLVSVLRPVALLLACEAACALRRRQPPGRASRRVDCGFGLDCTRLCLLRGLAATAFVPARP